MFLHAGASLHGHEYSLKTSPSSPPKPTTKGSLLKTALRPLSTTPDLSEATCFGTSSQHEQLSSRRASSGQTLRRPSLVLRQRAATHSVPKKDVAVRFCEHRMDRMHSPSASEDEESITGSDVTDETASTSICRKKRRRLPRKSTRYAVAQPAPQLRTKQRHLVQIRPRLLLQLQEIGDSRAIPAFDLVPSHLVAGTLILPKLVRRFPRIFRANAELGQNDVLLVRSDDYGSTPTRLSTLLSDDDGGAHHGKDVCAVISALPKRCDSLAELVLEDGSSWAATEMGNGSYEFTALGEDGETTTARWVRRSEMGVRSGLSSTEPPPARASWQDSTQGPRWTFSIIDPSSRRHPIMGSLTHETLDVYEEYTTLSTSSGRFPPSRSFGADGSGHQSTPAGCAAESRKTLQVRHEQKALMIATASWIRLHQQGWPESCNPKLAKAIPCYRRSVGGTPSSEARRQTCSSYEEDRLNATSCPYSPDSIHGPSLSGQQRRVGLPSRAMSKGRAFMKRRSKRLQEQELATVDSQKATLANYQREKSTVGEAEKTNCLSKMRQWTNRLIHRRKGIPS
ncbi:hypothetical protein E4U41_005766 [Claviceps citrina]|nr:hypothetical protein E4U41_005766 [Claviceps citrina]